MSRGLILWGLREQGDKHLLAKRCLSPIMSPTTRENVLQLDGMPFRENPARCSGFHSGYYTPQAHLSASEGQAGRLRRYIHRYVTPMALLWRRDLCPTFA